MFWRQLEPGDVSPATGIVQLIKGVFFLWFSNKWEKLEPPPQDSSGKERLRLGFPILKMKRRHQSSWCRLWILRTSKEGHWMVMWIGSLKEFLPNFTIKKSPKNIHWQIDRDENRPTHLVKKLMAIKRHVAIEATFMFRLNQTSFMGWKKMKLLKLGTHWLTVNKNPFLFRSYRRLYYPVTWGLFHESWHKDPYWPLSIVACHKILFA